MLVRRQSRLQASRRERNFMERVVSKKDLGTVPLVYLEGVLFPSIFWRLPHSSDGGILGSIPTPLFCQHDTRKQFGVASMADHAKMRLKSVGNTASTSPDFLAFTFDTLANGAVEGHDTRIVLSRGFESCMGPAGMRLRDQDDDLYSDGIDNRQNVHNLCAAERIRSSDLFVTLTCNQARHFGIKKIKNYVDSGEALENYKKYLRSEFPTHKELSARASKEVQLALNEASRTLIVRHWLEVKKFLLEYLLKSPEMPLTEILKLFCRDEYQSGMGNLCHMHMLVTLQRDYSSFEGRKAIQKLVRGFVDDIVCDDEVEQFIEEGILDDYNDYREMKDEARSFLPHTHSSRCMRRTGAGKDDLKCRVPDTRYISADLSQFHEAVLPTLHSKESLVIMSRLGLVTVSEDNEVVPQREFLKARRIYAPARFGEGNITPVVGRLFAATRSTMNVQICTSHGTTRYVVKYVIKIDECNYVVMSCKKGEEGLKAEQVFLHNTKISSSAINEKKRLDASRHSNKPRGRAVAVTEMQQIILGKPQVFCSMEFIRVPSLPLGERPGCERKPPEDKFNDLVADGKVQGSKDSFNFMVPIVKFRIDHCALCRQHTDSQVMMLEDQMVSRVTLDRVFIFGVRPPELLPFDKMEWYFRYFERSEKCVISKTVPLNDLLFRSYEKSVLLDGLGHRLRIRCKAIPAIRALLQDKEIRQQFPVSGGRGMLYILDKICDYYTLAGITIGQKTVSAGLNISSDKEWKHLQLMYVSYYYPKKELPIVVFSNVKPRNACKFAIHVLLSMGHFSTERDLWVSSSVRKAFVIAKLVPDRNGPSTDDDVDALLKFWIEDQLRTYPIGSTMMDQYIVTADDILRSILVHGILPLNEIPPVMYTSLVQETSKEITAFLEACKIDVVDATLKALMEAYSEHEDVLPVKQKLLKATKHEPLSAVDWNPIGPQTASQSNESYREQSNLNREVQCRIDQYRSPSNGMPKNMLIAGPPGVGKTHCLTHSVCYALSQGLFPMTTALLAERAFLLGGKHLHLLFKLSVRDRGTPHRLAELAVIALQKKIEIFVLLRHIDVLFIDECGQISAELLSVLDIILRKVRGSDLFMGGILIIGTIDQVQLRPIKGLPFLLSPYVLTTFCMTVLKQYVRCADCLVLQQLNELARSLSGLGEHAHQERLNSIRDLMNRHCTFVDEWTDPVITDDVLRVFPRREEAAAAVTTFLGHKKEEARKARRPYVGVKATDSMIGMENHSNWVPANRSVVSLLNKQCREPQHLDLYEGAIYQFTFNCPGRFKSTQLGILLHVPSHDILEKHGEFEIFVAPAGTRTFRIPNMSEDCLVSMGFTKSKVGTAPDRSHNLFRHGVKAKRKQYALKHHIASTIHSAIGHTVFKLATELGAENNLWERAMVVVLISRVKRASDLIFVGDKKANIDALIEGLQARNQYDDYMENIVRVLTGESGHMEPLSLNLHPFRYKDISLPQDRSGLVYMLVSLRDTSSMYIGQTTNMLLRLKGHNSGFGAYGSSSKEKRPWGLYAYICGFGGDKSLREEVESHWQNKVDFLKPKSPRLALRIGQRMLNIKYSENKFTVIVADEW
jgi:predicted GIY-YIG superfamily endonuclease